MNKWRKWRALPYLLTGVVVLLSFSFAERSKQVGQAVTQDKPLNVILMIGDGMGLSQVSAGLYFGKGSSNFERFPVVGLIKTSSASHKITDSAAGATAFSCGEKTYNGAIGVDHSKEPKKLENIVEQLSGIDYQTGVISTSSVTHATPASFYAHVLSRGLEDQIATQLVKSDIDFFSGGGLKFFAGRKDSLDLIGELTRHNFEVHTDKLIGRNKLSVDKKYGFLLADSGMPKAIEGRGDFLGESVELSLDYFDKVGKPFFLMIEGSQIDWGGHGNDDDFLIGEQLDFDKTIGLVLDYAEKNPNTLVIVTADHETGGFTLSSKKKILENGDTISDYNDIGPTFSTGGHSGTMIPVFAFGPHSEIFTGIYENTDIYHKIKSLTME